jgi:hypothetical protein
MVIQKRTILRRFKKKTYISDKVPLKIKVIAKKKTALIHFPVFTKAKCLFCHPELDIISLYALCVEGIVSRDWGGLRMVWLKRTEVQIIPG